jgi:hypothetical protein
MAISTLLSQGEMGWTIKCLTTLFSAFPTASHILLMEKSLFLRTTVGPAYQRGMLRVLSARSQQHKLLLISRSCILTGYWPCNDMWRKNWIVQSKTMMYSGKRFLWDLH